MADDNYETFKYNPEENYDEATMLQQRDIENKIAESQSLVGVVEDLSTLIKEFALDEVYQAKVKYLQKKNYSKFRRTRGDGNCFYRAFAFAYMEQLINDKEELNRFRTFAQKSKDELVSLGFPQFTIEDFHDAFMQEIDRVASGCSIDDLLNDFNDQALSDYIVVYLRLLVSGYLQKEADFYSCFVEGNRSVKEFCQQEVEPMGRESDHIHISILTSASGVPVRIEYLDRSVVATSGASSDAVGQISVNHHSFPDDSNPKISLLYRPGHYDILYA